MILSELTEKKIKEYGKNVGLTLESAESIFIFGAGYSGRNLYRTLTHYKITSNFIDNDPKKIGTLVEGCKVYEFEKIKECNKKKYIIIACSDENRLDIERQLIDSGLEEKREFVYINDFINNEFPPFVFHKYNQIFMGLVQISLTERCTLKCKYCAHACYNVKFDEADMDVKMAKKSIEIFFKHIDYVNEFVLIGGEPFLYNQLAEIIYFISDNYRNKVSRISITTNGTIIPNAEIITALRRGKVYVNISDYTSAISNLKKTHMRLRRVFDENDIDYSFLSSDSVWTDYGIGKIDRKLLPDEIMHVFNTCNTPCREIREDRFYYCVMARAVSENLKLEIGNQDYINLSEVNENNRFKVLAYHLGYSSKGYLEMCNYCYGGDRYQHPIPAAEQIGR